MVRITCDIERGGRKVFGTRSYTDNFVSGGVVVSLLWGPQEGLGMGQQQRAGKRCVPARSKTCRPLQ